VDSTVHTFGRKIVWNALVVFRFMNAADPAGCGASVHPEEIENVSAPYLVVDTTFDKI
jgi:hypothetical protein